MFFLLCSNPVEASVGLLQEKLGMVDTERAKASLS